MKVRRGGGISRNIEDRRAQGATGGSMGKGLQMGGGAGILAIIALVVSLCATQGGGGGSGFDLTQVFNQLPQAQVAPGSKELPPASPQEDQMVEFVSFVLDDIQAVWAEQFRAAGQTYQDATLVLFRGSTSTACGLGSAQMGPFYCPLDQKVYLDLNFFEELATKFGAPGDFASAYVIAHELGHHVQKLTGINDEVRTLQEQNPNQANDLSIRQELQADCFAGVWATSTYERGILDEGDIDEGLRAASSVGDDYIQKELGSGRVNPDTWTHGSSEQRVKWFKTGFESGEPDACDTFSIKNP
ncbi:MAG: neutral zinc metallopeptidase [Dehalococcoidia bacterium]|nr:zinc metallopeptidase [Thermoflexaceae bacterium]